MMRLRPNDVVTYRVRHWMRQPFWLLQSHAGPKMDVFGISVIVAAEDCGLADAQNRVQNALELLSSAGRWFFRQVARYVGHIVVWDGHYSAFDAWGGIHLSKRHLTSFSSEELAGALVHEAVHLRIENRRIPYLPVLRSRIEAMCVRWQFRFLDTVGAPHPTIEDELSHPWWETRDRRENEQRILADQSVPRWIGHLLAWLRGP